MLRRTRRWRKREEEHARWLGVICDKSLSFDKHCRARVEKARKMLGVLSGMGGSQWVISPSCWRQLYTGMIRSNCDVGIRTRLEGTERVEGGDAEAAEPGTPGVRALGLLMDLREPKWRGSRELSRWTQL